TLEAPVEIGFADGLTRGGEKGAGFDRTDGGFGRGVEGEIRVGPDRGHAILADLHGPGVNRRLKRGFFDIRQRDFDAGGCGSLFASPLYEWNDAENTVAQAMHTWY